MSKRVRLENIVLEGFSKTNGRPIIKTIEEHVCETCRHLVEQLDKYCWYCGEELESSSLTEHWASNKKLSEEQFLEAKNLLELKDIKEYFKKIPDLPVLNTIPLPSIDKNESHLP